jgi:Integrase core domain
MRDELLNGEEFDSPLEARVVIAGWVELYNRERPQCGTRHDDARAYAAHCRGEVRESNYRQTMWTGRQLPGRACPEHPAGCRAEGVA